MATIPTFKSYPDPFITIPLNDIPPIPALTYSLGPPPARLLNATLPPQFKYLDAGQLARMHEKFPRKVNEKGYVVFRWMAEDHHGPPVIFVTTALEIAIFDARKEALKNTGMDLDASMITRIAPGMAWTKKFDEMRSLPYLLQVTTLNDVSHMLSASRAQLIPYRQGYMVSPSEAALVIFKGKKAKRSATLTWLSHPPTSLVSICD
jgi:hypothetical protein